MEETNDDTPCLINVDTWRTEGYGGMGSIIDPRRVREVNDQRNMKSADCTFHGWRSGVSPGKLTHPDG